MADKLSNTLSDHIESKAEFFDFGTVSSGTTVARIKEVMAQCKTKLTVTGKALVFKGFFENVGAVVGICSVAEGFYPFIMSAGENTYHGWYISNSNYSFRSLQGTSR